MLKSKFRSILKTSQIVIKFNTFTSRRHYCSGPFYYCPLTVPASSDNRSVFTLHDMDEKLMESYLDNIAELVIDEDKIVTYKSLSKSLGIHVNTSKQLLYKFLTKQKPINSFPISATYLLAGKLPNGSFNISIINEIDLYNTRLKFEEITSEHVYSIQKGKNLKDVKVLCEIDKDRSDIKRPLVIKCSKSILKSRGEVKKKTNSCQETDKKLIEEALAPWKETVVPVEVNKKPEGCVNKDFAAKSTAKKSPKNNPTKAQADVKKSAGNIASLFAKAHQRNADKSASENKNASEDKQSEIEAAGVSAVEEVEKKEANLKTEMNSLQKCNEKTGTVKKKKNGSKRRRIQMISDSENSDSDKEEAPFAEEFSSLDAANIEDEREKVKESMPRNKRKKRKVIDRTVMNEDGYLETKKEIIFETDSENDFEEEKNANSEQKKAKVAPASDKGKGVQTANIPKKQSSLLAFFKKS